MLRDKTSIAAGTFVLAVVAFMSTKAAGKRFFTASSAYYSHTGLIVTLFKGVSGGTNNLTTAKASGKYISVSIGGESAKHRVFAVNGGGVTSLAKTVFLK